VRVSKDEWHDWKEHPVTQEFFRAVRNEREEFLMRLAHGQFSEEPGKQNLVVGAINFATKILETDFVEE
jgi:hypothetical protein